jgi:hypothetical protein
MKAPIWAGVASWVNIILVAIAASGRVKFLPVWVPLPIAFNNSRKVSLISRKKIKSKWD